MWGDEDVGVEPRVKAAAATPSVGKAQAAPSGISPFAAAAPTATKTWGSDDSSDEEHGASAPRTPHQAGEGEEQPSSLLDASTGCTTDFAAGMDMFSKARESAQAAAAAAATAAAAAPVDDFDPFAAPAEDPTAAPAAAAPGALTLEQLSAMPVDAQKNALGNGLYPLILAAVGEPALAGKITGMFLEMEAAALLPLLTAPNVLGAKVQEAVEVLQAHEAAQATATATPAAATAAAAAAAPADSADAVALCVKDLGKALKESNKDKLGRVVAAFGIAEARATLKATQEQEAAGGMMTDAGDRRRSAGGVFFKLLQDAHPAAMKDIITANNKFRKAQGKKGKAGAKGGKVVAPAPGKGTKHGLLGSPEVSQQKRQRTGEPGVAAAAAPGNFPSLFAAVKAGAQ